MGLQLTWAVQQGKRHLGRVGGVSWQLGADEHLGDVECNVCTV